ncbi:MAG: choice-of-anchor B family protein [Saprospiraceae bacterium]|nr:choice-of-anchor B family protein [Saprospiraceae bacterium]
MRLRSALPAIVQRASAGASLVTMLLLTTFPIFAQNINTAFRSKLTYPGQTLANVWGYESRGREYALVGGAQGLIIVDITNPAAPQQIVQIPGPNNLWKEIKTYSHYAYITSEGGQGIQIVDLTELPSPTLQSHFYKGDGAILNQLNTIHALHIDETKGFLYAWGGGLFGGGAKIFDLKPDPYNPVYVGKYDQLGYIHDGYVDNDTMYSCHIYAGQFAIVNMANKSAPELINTQTTPGAFVHNTWITDDRRTILATDEVNNSFLSAWDVSDPTDIKFLDKIQSNPGSNSMVHNTYVRGNWAVTSWYKDGFTIVDITRPDNLIQVGNHDTYAPSGGGSEGCWGVYHNFTSGNIIASNINVGGAGELWVITPNYVRACYLEGKITHGITGAALQGAQIQVIGSTPLLQELSAANGIYKTGQQAEGYYKVRVSKTGFQDFETLVYFQRGEVIVLDVPLFPTGMLNVTGTVVSHEDGQPVVNATVWLYGAQNFGPVTTNAAGSFSFSNISPGNYDIAASAPGLGLGMISGQSVVANTNVLLELFTTYRRDAVIEHGKDNFENSFLKIAQNPFESETVLAYQLPVEGAALMVLNGLGQTMQKLVLTGSAGQVSLGSDLPAGLYFVVLNQEGKTLEVLKMIKNANR